MTNNPEPIGDTLAAKTEKLKNNQLDGKGKNGGARPGAGRKKHGKNKKTLEREKVLEGFRRRVELHADRLFNAQADLATGEKFLYCVTTTTDKKGKQTKHTEIVTDPETIARYLDDTLDYDQNEEYYYISSKPANNMAIDSLLNRAFGTPNKNIDVKSNGQTILDRMDDTDVKRIASAMSEALSGTDDDEPTE